FADFYEAGFVGHSSARASREYPMPLPVSTFFHISPHFHDPRFVGKPSRGFPRVLNITTQFNFFQV
ncbi:hypothetical protein DXG01_016266, partial [Tephrocybe rancida]